MNNELFNVKLKKISNSSANETSNLNLPQLCNEENYQELMEETYLEKYYEIIKDLTFPSVFETLTKETANSIIRSHKEFKNENRFQWTQELQNLAEIIDKLKNSQTWTQIFIRLSSRSPKDAALSASNFVNLYKEAYDFVEKDEQKLQSPTYKNMEMNRKLHALYRASTYALKVSNGKDAVKLLVESDRIQGDLLEYVEGKIKYLNVVVREFRTFDPDLEFRGFIYQGNLTALTQYNEFVYFPSLKEKKQVLQTLILELFHQLAQKIPLKNYVLDFLLCVDKEENYGMSENRYDNLKLWIVELNPLAEFAGTGLFSWTKDKATLLGYSPFEFRVLEQVPAFALQNLPPQWKQLIE